MVGAASPHVLAHAVLAAFGAMHPLIAEIHQGIDVVVGEQPDAAAIATIATIGSAEGDVFFAAKAHAAAAAIAGLDPNQCLVDELHAVGPIR